MTSLTCHSRAAGPGKRSTLPARLSGSPENSRSPYTPIPRQSIFLGSASLIQPENGYISIQACEQEEDAYWHGLIKKVRGGGIFREMKFHSPRIGRSLLFNYFVIDHMYCTTSAEGGTSKSIHALFHLCFVEYSLEQYKPSFYHAFSGFCDVTVPIFAILHNFLHKFTLEEFCYKLFFFYFSTILWQNCVRSKTGVGKNTTQKYRFFFDNQPLFLRKLIFVNELACAYVVYWKKHYARVHPTTPLVWFVSFRWDIYTLKVRAL